MLVELSIKNFAIIEKQSIVFDKGLTVLTGETGAGKSIIIDAIGILVGGRGSTEFIRHGQEKAELEGLFQFDEGEHPALQKAREFDIDVDDNTLIFRRVLTANGKSTCYVNGQIVRASTLREIGLKTIDIHGQHEHQELMNESIHLQLLDKYGADEITSTLLEYKQVYKEYLQTYAELKQYNQSDELMAQKLELLKFQLEEISSADLQIGEEEKLIEEKSQLNNFEKICAKLQNAYTALANEHAGLELLGVAMREIESIRDFDADFKTFAESLTNTYYILEDTSRSIHHRLDSFEFDAERLFEVETRLDTIHALKRKYGSSEAEILAFATKSAEEIASILNKENRLQELTIRLQESEKNLLALANQLTTIRKQAAILLEEKIHQELQDLYMEKARFQVHFSAEKPSSTGVDVVEFYIAANPGEPFKPLSKTASGGELSRIMLAIKTIFSNHQGITSIIFDEIDSGVSGRVAQSIAEKIYRISTDSQVLCISHLPHVAAMADRHIFITKDQLENSTRTVVTVLSEEERISEIGRMISGKDTTESTENHVREMFLQASQIKGKFIKQS